MRRPESHADSRRHGAQHGSSDWRLNVAPLNDPTAAVVLGMDTSNVDSVFVAGRPLKWRGSLVGVDVDRLLHQLSDVHEALLARAGV